jgi:HEPN domain-containing protein
MNMAKEWLKAVNNDILTIQEVIHNEHLSSIVAFHSQQAIEKSFKAIIANDNIKIPKQHDLIKLYNLINKELELDDNELNILDILNQLYIDSRYPGSFGLLPNGKPTIDDAKEFYKLSNDIFNIVCKLLNVDKSELISK